MINLDGSLGGGSVVRLAAGLAVAYQQQIKIENIRQHRPSPGLKHQHVAGLRAVADLCQGKLEGNKVGSRRLTFSPGSKFRQKVTLKIATAGSIGLSLQPLLIASLAAEQKFEVEVTGGATAGKWAPPLSYLQHVLYPLLEKLGINIELKVEIRGFYPQGGARLRLKLTRGKKRKFILKERGGLQDIKVISLASHHLQNNQVAERQAKAAKDQLVETKYKKHLISSEETYVDASSPGSCLLVVANFENCVLGGDAIGEKGKRAERVGREAVEGLVQDLSTKATLDRYGSDQMIPFIGVLGGSFTYPRLTDHLKSNVEVTNHFCPKQVKINKKRERVER